MRILGIETSCDETGVAIYDSEKGLLAHRLYSQITMHAEYGGVVPELASRDHIRKITPLIKETLWDAELAPADIDGIAYTAGPGLAGALLVGACVARTIAFAWDIPAIAVHHLEGHLLAPMLEPSPPTFPFVALLVSGGHTQLINVPKIGEYRILGESLDDAVGEAFDKTAKLLGFDYPGGAALAALAESGDPNAFHFPRPMLDRPGFDFSFSGLKTHAAHIIASHAHDRQTHANIAYAFQEAAIETLVQKSLRALQFTGHATLVVAGGVGANKALRKKLETVASDEGFSVYFPRQAFCTDNGAMIAYAGCQRLLAGQKTGLKIEVYPRWPLSDL